MARLQTSLWIAAWDVLDEGADLALRQARDLAGADAVNLAVTYHAGWFLLPHNPRRHLYVAEDGVAYFPADPRHFSRVSRVAAIQPTRSTLVAEADPLEVALRAAQRLGMGVRAWMVCCHNSRLAQAMPRLAVRTPLGDLLPFAVCPAQPEVQAYLSGLVAALGDYPGLEAIELEALYWQPVEHAWHHPKFGLPLDPQAAFLLGLCCCPACTDAAGVDPERLVGPIRTRLLAALEGESLGAASRASLAAISPELEALLEAREAVLTRLLSRLVAEAHVPVRALVGSGLVEAPWTRGIDLGAWAREATSLTVNAYHSSAEAVRATLATLRASAPRAALNVGLNATYPLTLDEAHLTALSLAALPSGPSELSYYHYGLLTLQRLGWVGRAAARARTAGNEAVLGDG